MDTDALYAAITRRARAAAGEPVDDPRPPKADPLGPMAALLYTDPDAPPCTTDDCSDPAYVRVILQSGSSDDADGYCARCARRLRLDHNGIIRPLGD